MVSVNELCGLSLLNYELVVNLWSLLMNFWFDSVKNFVVSVAELVSRVFCKFCVFG